MTSSLHHNDVITVKILSFYKNFTNKRRKSLETFLNLKKKTKNKKAVQNKKENFRFNKKKYYFKEIVYYKACFFSENLE